MYLINPATYLSVTDFKAQPNDYDLTPYTDSQLQDILVRASGAADAIMRQSFLPQEQTEYFDGNGTNFLLLCRAPILYVKSVQLVMPGFAPFSLPLGQLLVDYERGTIRTYSPLVFQSLGVANVFPANNMPIVVQYAWGYNYPIAAPSFTLSAGGSGGSLNIGTQYDVTVTSRTTSGESLPSTVQTFTATASTENIVITVQPGAFVYRVYMAEHGGTRTLVAESPATNYGTPTITVNVTSLSAPQNYGTVNEPTSDTSARPLPSAITEAVRLLAMSQLYENNNLANRGVYLQESGRKRVSWKSTEGNSGKGIPLYVSQAEKMLEPYVLSAVF